jgi:hypothetical protein
MRRSSPLAPALLAALGYAGDAQAFCRTSYCTDVGTSAVCDPAAPSDCGTPLKWPQPCVGYSIHQGASSQLSLEATEQVFERAFAAWTEADCGGGTHPRIQVGYAGPVACDQHEYNQNAGNANIIVYRDGAWPHEGAGNTLALTTVTYSLETSDIYDADMELNSADAEFTTTDVPGEVMFDLQSIATHEVGHFLGLAHSIDAEATMNAGYNPGTITLRDLALDDISGICAAYPPGEPITSCDSTPRHGFSGECATNQQEEEGCAVAAPGRGGGADGALAALAGVAAAALLARGARSRRRPRR